MSAFRAKFRVTHYAQYFDPQGQPNQESVQLVPCEDDGTEETRQARLLVPSGNIQLTATGAAMGKVTNGLYYLDLTPVTPAP